MKDQIKMSALKKQIKNPKKQLFWIASVQSTVIFLSLYNSYYLSHFNETQIREYFRTQSMY